MVEPFLSQIPEEAYATMAIMTIGIAMVIVGDYGGFKERDSLSPFLRSALKLLGWPLFAFGLIFTVFLVTPALLERLTLVQGYAYLYFVVFLPISFLATILLWPLWRILDKKFPTLWLEDIEKATKGAKRVTASMGDVHRRQKELAKELNDVIADSQRGLDMIEELLDKVREKIDLTDDLEKQIKQRHRLLEKLEEEIESAVVNAERSKKPKK